MKTFLRILASLDLIAAFGLFNIVYLQMEYFPGIWITGVSGALGLLLIVESYLLNRLSVRGIYLYYFSFFGYL